MTVQIRHAAFWLTVAALLWSAGVEGGREQAVAPAQPTASAPTPLALDQPLPVDPAVRIGRFSNGLRYYIRRNGRPNDRVALRLAVDVGSIQEEDDQRGLAHFLTWRSTALSTSSLVSWYSFLSPSALSSVPT